MPWSSFLRRSQPFMAASASPEPPAHAFEWQARGKFSQQRVLIPQFTAYNTEKACAFYEHDAVRRSRLKTNAICTSSNSPPAAPMSDPSHAGWGTLGSDHAESGASPCVSKHGGSGTAPAAMRPAGTGPPASTGPRPGA